MDEEQTGGMEMVFRKPSDARANALRGYGYELP
jgi:hypothetical protein